MIKFDYEKTAKFDMSISGWGGEDVKFFENCIHSKVCLKIVFSLVGLVYSNLFVRENYYDC